MQFVVIFYEYLERANFKLTALLAKTIHPRYKLPTLTIMKITL